MTSSVQFTNTTAAEAHKYLSMLHPDSVGEQTPAGKGEELNMPERTRRQNVGSKQKNWQNVGSRPTGDLTDSLISDAWTGRGFEGGTHDRVTTKVKRGPKPSIDPQKANKGDLREIGASMARGDWEPEVTTYNDPKRAKATEQSPTVWDDDKNVVPAKGIARVRRNQFGGVSMRTLAGNPALRRQLRLGAASEGVVPGEYESSNDSGITSGRSGDPTSDLIDERLARSGVQPDAYHTPKSQAKPDGPAPRKMSVFEHVEQNGVTEPVEVFTTAQGMSIPNPLHRMRIAAAHFHDATQNIPIRHISD